MLGLSSNERNIDIHEMESVCDEYSSRKRLDDRTVEDTEANSDQPLAHTANWHTFIDPLS